MGRLLIPSAHATMSHNELHARDLPHDVTELTGGAQRGGVDAVVTAKPAELSHAITNTA